MNAIDPDAPGPRTSQSTRDQRGKTPADPGSVSPSRNKPKKPGRDDPPTIESAKPGQDPATKDLIPIPSGAPRTTPKKKAVSTPEYWMNYYKTHDEKASDLKDKITILNINKKTRDVEWILRGYLTHRNKDAEFWMYEALALAIKINRGSDKEFKTYLGYAADMAERTGNPNHLVSVADMLYLNGQYARVGKLVDMAAEKVPHRAEPLMMSINLAQRTRDPKRMAASIDRLLALGWPGVDDAMRADARKQAETLAKTLREEQRQAEADTLLASLPASEARDLFVRLTWSGDADLDLVVDEPLGATARYSTPRTVFGGSIIKNGYGTHPEEVYVCPRAFDGNYAIRVETVYNNPEKPALQATLEIITHEGTPKERKETKTITLGKAPEMVGVPLKDGRRKVALPFLSPAAILPPPSVATGTKPKSPTASGPNALKTKGAKPATGGATKPANPAAKEQGVRGLPR